MTPLDQCAFVFKQHVASAAPKRGRIDDVDALFRSTPLADPDLRRYAAAAAVDVTSRECVHLTTTFTLPIFSTVDYLEFAVFVFYRPLPQTTLTHKAEVLQQLHCGGVRVTVKEVLDHNATSAVNLQSTGTFSSLPKITF